MAFPSHGVTHRPTVTGTRGMVSSAHPLASLAGGADTTSRRQRFRRGCCRRVHPQRHRTIHVRYRWMRLYVDLQRERG